ncbi:MAG: type II toxin-antitoxin system RelE/ParE family toxin [Alphaproteobacteria bacterium]|nr:type II toxin-antitoxin system RelE/ParE family toxin [Alphaproteobacteria bacterium]
MSGRKALKPIVTTRAEREIRDIADYIAEHNIEAAINFLGEINEQFVKIGQHPEAAPLAAEFGPNIRKRVSGNYLLLYTLFNEQAIILAVQHGKKKRRRIVP